MKVARLTIVGLILIAAIAMSRVANAVTLENSNNGAGSNNSMDIQWNQSSTVLQGNNGSVSNNVDANANTGGNSVGGSGDGSIKTGDAIIDINIKNKLNTNKADIECCKDGKTTPTPTLKPGQSPTPTATPTTTNNVGGPPGPNNGGNPGPNGGGTGGGEVIGLSAASGENYTEMAFTATGIVCLLAGVYLTRKNHLAL